MSNQSDLDEATSAAPLVDPDRLRLARELRGWTQAELTDRAGRTFSEAAVSQLERGHTRPSPSTLLAIANATGCPIQFFVARPGDHRREGFFRTLQATSARDRKRHLANARLLHELVTVLEEHIDFPDLDVPRFAGHPRAADDIEAAAEATRHAWRLEEGPIPNVVRVLERHGIVVVRVANFAREVDAFSVRHEGRPIVVLGSEKAVTARSRFDAAHELAHLVLHEENDAGKRQTENEAHQFAAAFLMPASDIRRELPTTADWGQLMKLKVRWRVSIAALLRRAVTLQVMPQHRYVNAVKAMSARGWRTREPGDEKLGSLESPVLLSRALARLADAGVSLDALVEEASLPISDLRTLIELTRDPRPRVEL
jgi:Zn-dependent peptidase ImmA (M78 family)/DNA-binding XRE family transcriptional regulator